MTTANPTTRDLLKRSHDLAEELKTILAAWPPETRAKMPAEVSARLTAATADLQKTNLRIEIAEEDEGRKGVNKPPLRPGWEGDHDKPGAKAVSFGQAVIDAGLNLKSRPSVEVPANSIFFPAEAKASDFGAAANWGKVPAVSVASLGEDQRFLWSSLHRQDSGSATSIDDWRQTSRTLTGSPLRALDSVAEKADLAIGLAMVNVPMVEIAIVVRDVPNALIESSDALRSFLESEGRYQVSLALDMHVVASIIAALPPFGTSGATLVQQIRNAVSAMRALGSNPGVLALDPSDAALLDLAEVGTAGMLFATRATGSASPIWSMQTAESPSMIGHDPMLIDAEALGTLYVSSVKVELDPYSSFTKNLTNLRVECHALMMVRNKNGAYRVAAA